MIVFFFLVNPFWINFSFPMVSIKSTCIKTEVDPKRFRKNVFHNTKSMLNFVNYLANKCLGSKNKKEKEV